MNLDWSQIVQPNEPLAKPTEILTFEESLGLSLPVDYRQFLLTFNGGKVLPEHDIYLPEISCNVYVSVFFPLSASSPSLGIVEARRMQICEKLYLRQAIQIAGDLGTGDFYIILDGENRGEIYFVWKDDAFFREGDWFSSEVSIPNCMVPVCSDFNALGRLILENAKNKD